MVQLLGEGVTAKIIGKRVTVFAERSQLFSPFGDVNEVQQGVNFSYFWPTKITFFSLD